MFRVECEICGSYYETNSKVDAQNEKKDLNGICPICLSIGSLCIIDNIMASDCKS